MLVTENIKGSIDITQIETKRAEIRTSLRRPRDLASTIPARTEDRGHSTNKPAIAWSRKKSQPRTQHQEDGSLKNKAIKSPRQVDTNPRALKGQAYRQDTNDLMILDHLFFQKNRGSSVKSPEATTSPGRA